MRSRMIGRIALLAAAAAWIVNAAPGRLGASGSTLLFDDFDDGDAQRGPGLAWTAFGDQAPGGKSQAQVEVISSGAQDSKHALRVSGELKSGFEYPFAGAFATFDAGPVGKDMRTYSGVRFFARGDGKSYQIQVLCSAVQDGNNYSSGFTAESQWKLYEVKFADLAQNPYWGAQVEWTGMDVGGVAFRTADSALGQFRLEVDQIEFY